MAKIYSDEEIDRLSKNPHVSSVSRHRLSLKLEFKQQIYDIWIRKPVASTVRKVLLENGFDTHELGTDFYKNLSKAFKHWGRPKEVHRPSCNDENAKFNLLSDEQITEANTVSDTFPHPTESSIGKDAINLSLVQSGKFTMTGETVDFSPDYVSVLFASYPQTNIYEALSKDGFSVYDIGETRIRRLERMFSLYRAAGTAPYESRGKERLLEEGEILTIQRNPFVKSVSPTAICMNDKFHTAASVFRGMPVDPILDIFMVGHRNFSLPEKTRIMELLEHPPESMRGSGVFGNTIYDACILRRRMAALEGMVRECCLGIAGILPSLKPSQKKQVCIWIKELPADPDHIFTRKSILKQIGISRSSYYEYVGRPDFGMGEIRRKERDEANARLVRTVIAYKGFRKGSRQVYMLLPRLTGKRISLKKIRLLMKEYGMECGIRDPNPSREARSAYEKDAVKPNILRRRFRLYRPNRVRVTDVTYLDYGDRKRAYGSALMDPVTGRLVAFVVSEKNNLEMALETLRVSDSHPCEDGGIFHSDQGTLYKSGKFQKEILDRGLHQSMSKKGNCWDNATQESFFGHFKDECDYSSCADLEELKKRVAEYSWYYNNERGMWERGRMTPAEYEEYLLGLNEEQFGEYLAAEEKKYDEMKKKAAELAKKRYGTLGV